MTLPLADGLRAGMRRFPALRAVVKQAAVQHLIKTIRGAKAVREPFRFVARQFATPQIGSYHLRESGLTILIRHRTRDVDVIGEIFGGTGGRRSYQPPAEVGSMLDGLSAVRVLDLGGNIGLFGAYAFGRWPQARVTAYEPDVANARLLSAVIAANGLEKRWRLVQAAATTREGSVPFAGGLFANSHIVSGSGGDALVPAVDIFAHTQDVDLVKMDIEGGEWEILADPRMSTLAVLAIVLEWHARGSPEPDAHAAVLRLLREAGYGHMAEPEREYDGNGLIWAWREPGETGFEPEFESEEGIPRTDESCAP